MSGKYDYTFKSIINFFYKVKNQVEDYIFYKVRNQVEDFSNP